MTPNKNTEMEERLKRICAMIFMSPPLDEHKIGDIRPKLDWQVKEIMQAIHSRDMEIIEKLEKERDIHILKNPPMPNTAMYKSTREALAKLDPVVNTYNMAISLLQEETK